MNEREQKILAATKEAQAKLYDMDEKNAAELLEIYVEARDNIEKMIRTTADQDGTIDPHKYYELQLQIDKRLFSLNLQRDALLDSTLKEAAKLGLTPWQDELLTDFVAHLADEAVEFVMHFRAADGLNLSDRIWKLNAGAVEGISRQLQQALAQGMDISRTVREFLAKQKPIPPELLKRFKETGAEAVANKVGAELLQDESGAYWKAKRLFRTEMNRAHGIAYQAAARNDPDVVGLQFLLSPNHPRPDICDFYARANLHGLGPGVFPFDQCPWPAHPNTLSFTVVVFRDEVLPEHATRDEPIAWMAAQSPEWQESVLGKQKADFLRSGQLRADQIATPLRVIKNESGFGS